MRNCVSRFMETRVVVSSRVVETCLRSFKVNRWRVVLFFCLIHLPHLNATLADGLFRESKQQHLNVQELILAVVHRNLELDTCKESLFLVCSLGFIKPVFS